MKWFFRILFFLLFLLILLGIVFWMFRKELLSSYLTNHLQVKTTIKDFQVSRKGVAILGLTLSNPLPSNSPYALSCDKIFFSPTYPRKHVINEVTLSNIKIYVEYYDSSGKKNNWVSYFQSYVPKKSEKKKDYLIKKLSLKNIEVYLVKIDGEIQELPMIEQMEFTNLSKETGLPLDQIERAIMEMIMQSIFEKHGLKTLLDSLNPVRIIKILPLPFFSENKSF